MSDFNRKMLARAREAFSASTSYFDANIRAKLENNIRLHQSRHQAGSKYYKAAYSHRSKGFWPKTRAAARQFETKVAKALFSNQDMVSIEPTDPNNLEQVTAARILKAVLNHRLSESIPWFQTCIAAAQDAYVAGVVCSCQYWEAESRKKYVPAKGPDGQPLMSDGKPVFDEVIEIVNDRPVIDIRPINNIRFSPDANFIDPVNSSPYFIDMLPMNIIDVEAKMRELDPETGKPKWRQYTREEMLSSRTNTDDSTDTVRRDGREDPHINHGTVLKDYTTVWVHRNFIRYGDEDYVFYTLGTEKLLTDPRPIREVYWTGQRPYVIGSPMIESHIVYPDSPVHVASHLQNSLNEIRNSRSDNVFLSMNGRWFGRRGAQVDWKSLVQNVAGSVTLMQDPASDAIPVKFPDVTQNAYMEQQVVNAGFDEITGAFSSSSIDTNRRMSETVGGMSMLKESGNELHEYFILTFVKTWVAPVMRQLVQLEQKYESDMAILSVAAGPDFERYGMSEDLDRMLDQNLRTTVNVGIDATTPESRAGKLLFAFGRISEILQNPVPGINAPEFIKEIFGALGYDDGSRFFDYEAAQSPMAKQIQELQSQLQQMQQALADREADRQLAREVAEKDRMARMAAKEMEVESKLRVAEMSSDVTADRAEADMIKTRIVQKHTDERKETEIAAKIAIEAMKNKGEGLNKDEFTIDIG